MSDLQQSEPSSATAPRELGIEDVVRFVLSSWLWSLTGAIIVGGVVASWGLSQPHQYESSANLIVSPSPFSKEMKTESLSLLSYQRILNSAAVLDAAKRKLLEQGVLKPGELLELGVQVDSRLPTSKRSDEALAPIIECLGRDEDPEHAAKLVNVWIETFLETARQQVSSNTAPTLNLFETKYLETGKRLAEIETKRLTEAATMKKKGSDLQTAWSQRILDHRLKSNETLVTFKNETEKLLAEQRAQKQVAVRKAQADSLNKALADIQGQLSMATALKPMVPGDPGPITTAPSAGLPASTVSRLREQERQLAEQLANMQTALNSDLLAIDTLQRNRENEYAAKSETFANEQAAMVLQQKNEMELHVRAEANLLDQLDREIVPLRDQVAGLAKGVNQAMLAKAQQASLDIQQLAPAVIPEKPLARGAANKAVMAAVLGAMAGMGIALLRTVGRRITTSP